jgi:hypothetical protein
MFAGARSNDCVAVLPTLARHAVAASREVALPSRNIPITGSMNIFLAVETAFKKWETMQNIGH